MLKKNTWVFLIFLIAGIALYVSVIDSFFLSDDFDWLVSGDIDIFFRPLSRLSFQANYVLGRLNPLSYHAVNVILHVLNAYLLFLLIPLLLVYFNVTVPKVENRWFSFVTALFFLVLSAHSESVTWISGRTNLLAMAFLLLSLYAYLQWRMKSRPMAFYMALGAFFLGLLSKEAVLTFPLIILGLDCFKKLADKKKPVPDFHVLWFFIVLAVYFAIRFAFTGHMLGTYNNQFFNIKLMIDNLRKFTLRAFFPAGDYLFVIMKYKIDFLIVGSILYFLWKQRENIYINGFLVFSFLMLLVPVCNLDISLIDSVNERFTYLASAFGAVILILLIFKILKQNKPVALVLVLLTGINIFGLVQSNQNWNRASVISKSILDSFRPAIENMKSMDNPQPIILNLPDSLRGAYIFRRGFNVAVKLFLGKDIAGRVFVVSTHGIYNGRDGMGAVSRGGGKYCLHIKNNRFMQTPVPSREELYTVENITPHDLTLILDEKHRNRPVWYYSKTQLHRLREKSLID